MKHVSFNVLFFLIWRLLQKFMAAFFAVLGAELLISELVNLIWKDFLVGSLFWLCALVLPLICGIKGAWPKCSVSAKISGTDTRVTCKIGNILKERGDVVITVNRNFDTSTLNRFVHPKSLQGQFQAMYYGTHEEDEKNLDKDIIRALRRNKDYVKIIRNNGKKRCYDVGVVAKLPPKKIFNNITYLLALASVTENGTTETSPSDFSLAIQKLWDFLKISGEKTRLCVPLIGTGRSGLNCDRETIAREIIFSFVAYARNVRIVNELVVCISRHDYFSCDISLDRLQEFLNVVCQSDTIHQAVRSSQEGSSKPLP